MIGTTQDARGNLSGPLRGIISALHDTIIIGLDRNGCYLFVWMDPDLEKRYGIDAVDLRGKSLCDMFPPEEAERRIALSIRAFETGERYREEYKIDVPGGEFWHDATIAPMKSADGEVTALVSIVHDVTERKRTERESEQLKVKMKRAEKLESLGIMAGGIAHDFNNVLMGIQGNIRFLLEEMPGDSPQKGRVLNADRAVRHAAELVQQLLVCSGRRAPKLQSIDLADLVTDTLELARGSLGETVSLRANLEEGMPAVNADALQIRQVLYNLVTNAAEAMGKQAGVVRVRVGTVWADRDLLSTTYLCEDLPEDRYAVLEVKDNGCGMTEEQISRVFDPFYTTKSRGRGLGLAPLPSTVRGHGGDVRLESRPGEGTTFQIFLPLPGAKS
jgi:PAS domain S-box-containing protein